MRLLTSIPRWREGWLEAILLPALVLVLTHFLAPQDKKKKLGKEK
jgi:hypothetical protein